MPTVTCPLWVAVPSPEEFAEFEKASSNRSVFLNERRLSGTAPSLYDRLGR